MPLPTFDNRVADKSVKRDVSVKWNKALKTGKFDDRIRRPAKVNLGCALAGYANPHPDTQHHLTAFRGACKRFIRAVPTPDQVVISRFMAFVRRWLAANLTPLACDVDVSFGTWLHKTKYTDARKRVLARKYSKIFDEWGVENQKVFNVKSFIKDEPYPEYKHARPINSRSDEFKCLIGPWFKPIEKALFSLDWFIKKVPIHKRPEFIIKSIKREGSFYVATDYTAYESHFTAQMMKACEFQLYEYMTQHVPDRAKFLHYLENVLAGMNVCEFKWFTLKCVATRMSGEMNTSLGNGFSNLMAMLFLCEESGATNVAGVVEGDDGLFSMTGDHPTTEDFKKLGFTIKMEIHKELETASFCGMVFDVNDVQNVTDPIDVLLDFGWTNSRYAKASDKTLLMLLKAKSLSLLYQYPGCPVVASLAKYGMRVTKGVRIGRVFNTLNQWEADQLRMALRYKAKFDVVVGMKTRFLVQEKFGLRVHHQIAMEKYLDGLDSVQTLEMPLVSLYAHEHARHYWLHYRDVRAVSDVTRLGPDQPILQLDAPIKEVPVPVINDPNWHD